MKFDSPAGSNPTDQLKVLGRPTDRIDGPLETTGTAPYAYEHKGFADRPAYGFILGAGIAKGRIAAIDAERAKAAPGVLAVITAAEAGALGIGAFSRSMDNAASSSTMTWPATKCPSTPIFRVRR